MDPKIDLSKLVGAASAPVALVIATCIYLGNLTTKFNTLFQQIRTLGGEIRSDGPDGDRGRSLQHQLELYEQRINGTMRSAFWLNVAILLFVVTVFLTGLGVLFQGNLIVTVATGVAMAAGLLAVISAVLIELWSNRLAKPTVYTELKSSTPRYEPVMSYDGHGK